MSTKKPIEHHQQHSKSSSKRLFASVFKILDDQFEVSCFEQTDTNGSKITKLMQNDDFVRAVMERIKQDDLGQLYPILKVRCAMRNGGFLLLEIGDLVHVFDRFGSLYTVVQHATEPIFYVLFTSFTSAYVAMKLLHQFPIRHSQSSLSVEWCPSEDYAQISHILPSYHPKVCWQAWQNWESAQSLTRKDSSSSSTAPSQNSKQCKLTCRYDIQIENEKDFQVARRIIGSKGVNMKKIIETALDQLDDGASSLANQMLKLRLRGRGSGYKQGPDQIESEEELHLCISSKDENVYKYACRSVQKLLQSVYCQYQDYTRKQGRPITLTIKKSQITSSQSNSNPNINLINSNNENVMRNIDICKNGRMEADKIQHFLELRNKARRELNFTEADRIRNYLRVCGVCLIDEKGRRGKATEVTTWKYLV